MKPGDDTATLPPIPDSKRWDEAKTKSYSPDELREVYLTHQAEAVVEYANDHQLTDAEKDRLIRAFKGECRYLRTAWTKELPNLESIPNETKIEFFRQYEAFVRDLVKAVRDSLKDGSPFSFDEWYWKYYDLTIPVGLLYGLENARMLKDRDALKKQMEKTRQSQALWELVMADPGQPKSKKAKRKRGRPDTTQDEAKAKRTLKSNWEKYHGSKTGKKSDFCESEGIHMTDLDAALRWCRDHPETRK